MLERANGRVLHFVHRSKLFPGLAAANFTVELCLISFHVHQHLIDVLFYGAQVSLNALLLKVPDVVLSRLHLLTWHYDLDLLAKFSHELIHDRRRQLIGCLLLSTLRLWRRGSLGRCLRNLRRMVDHSEQRMQTGVLWRENVGRAVEGFLLGPNDLGDIRVSRAQRMRTRHDPDLVRLRVRQRRRRGLRMARSHLRRREAHVVLLCVGRAQLAIVRLCDAGESGARARLDLKFATALLFDCLSLLLTLVLDENGVLIGYAGGRTDRLEGGRISGQVLQIV